jgi:uncharacterized membrane protein (UPF0127 family)
LSTSSKTPSNETEKTASARKGPKYLLLGGVGLLAALLVVVVSVLGMVGHASGETVLRAGKHRFSLAVVTSPEDQARGLGGLETMPQDEGMLFWYADEAVRCFWMKDMQFPLDLIWLDAQRRVVHLERNVSPQTYPKQFCPDKPARYVLELNAGQANAARIKAGQTLTF